MLQLRYVSLDEIKPWGANPKLHDVEGLKASIARYGFVTPLVVNEQTGQLMAGHGRLEALKELWLTGGTPPDRIQVQDGQWQVPVIYGVSLEEIEAHAYALDDNLSTMAGGDLALREQIRAFNQEQLAVDLKELMEHQALPVFALDDVGAIIDEILGREPREEIFDVAAALDDLPEPRIKRGEVWRLGDHRLMCGDSAEMADVDSLVGGTVGHAMLTDPPYGIRHEGMSHDAPDEVAILYFQVLTLWPMVDAVFAVFQSPRRVHIWLDTIQAQGHHFERLLWLYRRGGCRSARPWRGWVLVSDAIVLSSIGQPVWPSITDSDHDTYMTIGEKDEVIHGKHPSIKPLDACESILSKLPSGLVFDPFLGVGTTLMAAEQLGRACYAMEIEPCYCEVAIQRWEAYTGREAVLEHT